LIGQIGIKPDGTLPKNIEEQDEQCWLNILSILEDASFSVRDIVKINVLSTDPNALPIHVKHRAKCLNDGNVPASTWANISSLSNPQILIELDVITAKVN
jgi:enamine deaminase RidA (YjgF/YER057c/UK114 family)